MPIVDVTLLSGRTEEKKRTLIRELTDAVVRSLDAPPQSVRVVLREVDPGHFAVGGVTKAESNS